MDLLPAAVAAGERRAIVHPDFSNWKDLDAFAELQKDSKAEDQRTSADHRSVAEHVRGQARGFAERRTAGKPVRALTEGGEDGEGRVSHSGGQPDGWSRRDEYYVPNGA